MHILVVFHIRIWTFRVDHHIKYVYTFFATWKYSYDLPGVGSGILFVLDSVDCDGAQLHGRRLLGLVVDGVEGRGRVPSLRVVFPRVQLGVNKL